MTKMRNVGIVQHGYHQSMKYVYGRIQNHVDAEVVNRLMIQRLNNPIGRISQMIGQQYLFPFRPIDFENAA